MITNLYANNILEELIGRTNFPFVEGSFASLLTAVPNSTNPSGVEVVGASYIRQSVTWAAASNKVITNDSTIVFPIASTIWGTVVAVGFWNALTEGQLGPVGPLTPQLIEVGDQYDFAPGSIVIQISS